MIVLQAELLWELSTIMYSLRRAVQGFFGNASTEAWWYVRIRFWIYPHLLPK